MRWLSEIKINTLHNASAGKLLDYRDNTIVFSNVNQFSKSLMADGISIKFALNGTEHYYLNGKNITLRKGEYFVSNIPLDGEVNIDSKTFVQGICIHISYDLIRQIESSYTGINEPDYEKDIRNSSVLQKNIFNLLHLGNNNLSQTLKSLCDDFVWGIDKSQEIRESIFFKIGEAFVQEQHPLQQYNNTLGYTRSQTRMEIIKNLTRAKEYLESNYTHALQVKELSVIATMSEFHFARMFKLVFGLSPYQYQTRLRLEHAHMLIQKQIASVHEAALLVGYADVFTFSKAFKKHFRQNPSAFQISRN